MSWLRQFLFKFTALFTRRKLEREMAEEIRAHIEDRTRRNVEAGMDLDEARYAAWREFGGVEQVKEQARDQNGWRFLENLVQDLRHSVRQLRKSPTFAAVAIISLAVGIGANTAIFSVTHALLLRSLPVPDPQRLVLIGGAGTYARFDQLRHDATSLSIFAVGHTTERRSTVGESDSSGFEMINVEEDSGECFSVLGVAPALGRALVEDDDRPHSARRVAVLSYGFWQRRFGGDPAVLGQTVTVSNVPLTIVGVAPAGFYGVDAGRGRGVDLWCPLWLKPELDDGFEGLRLTQFATGSSWLIVMGRLHPGVSLEQSRAELMTISQRDPPGANLPPLTVQPGDTGFSRLRNQFRQPIRIVQVIAGLVLLVSCANVGGLLIARGAARQREIAVRLAMGAGRGRIARQLLTESLLLAALGSIFGLLFASWGGAVLARYMDGIFGSVINWPALAFTSGTAIGSTCILGLLPAWHLSRLDLTAAFKDGASSVVNRSRQRLNRMLVITQIGLSFVLVTTASLFIRTLQNLRSEDPGFERENLLQFNVELGRLRSDTERAKIFARILNEVESVPGVEHAAITQGGRIGSIGSRNAYTVDGSPFRAGIQTFSGSRNCFATLGTPLLRGRDFVATDELPGAEPVAVITESVARMAFPDADPIGHYIRRGKDSLIQIIGIVRDAQNFDARKPAGPAIYLQCFQQTDGWAWNSPISIRTSLRPGAIDALIRGAVRRAQSDADVVDFRTATQLLDVNLNREKAVAELASFFSLLTLTLTGIGIYGVLAYEVTQRTREIGVRIALGAQIRDVLRLVVGRGTWLVVLGSGLGLIGALASTRLISSLLYAVPATDLVSFGIAAAGLLLIALVACWLPARRAARVDPMIALRCE